MRPTRMSTSYSGSDDDNHLPNSDHHYSDIDIESQSDDEENYKKDDSSASSSWEEGSRSDEEEDSLSSSSSSSFDDSSYSYSSSTKSRDENRSISSDDENDNNKHKSSTSNLGDKKMTTKEQQTQRSMSTATNNKSSNKKKTSSLPPPKQYGLSKRRLREQKSSSLLSKTASSMPATKRNNIARRQRPKVGNRRSNNFDYYGHYNPRRPNRRSSIFSSVKRSTAFLIFSVLVWLYTQYQTQAGPFSSLSAMFGNYGVGQDDNSYEPFERPLPEHRLREEMRAKREAALNADRVRKFRIEEAKAALGTVPDTEMRPLGEMLGYTKEGKRHKRSNGSGASDDIGKEQCVKPDWQTKSFPNCNEIHSVDLKEIILLQRRGRGRGIRGVTLPLESGMGMALDGKSGTDLTAEEVEEANKAGYIGSGLWRHVWRVGAGGENRYVNNTDGDGSDTLAVLKMMKAEHKYDTRNFDRHRRDALVMERFTSSPYVVSIYGFCGNTLLSEYVGKTLDEVIYPPKKKGEGVEKEVYVEEAAAIAARSTPIGRLQLALDTFRGLSALHNVTDGPVVHADIQAKQFLVDERTGTVKINDFNRCRFMKQDVDTNASCPVRIPTSPGKNRSPEEYNKDITDLTEKLDVYSAAHILYGILTGMHPWEVEATKPPSTSSIKNLVMDGKTPKLDKDYKQLGAVDALIVDLMEKAYAVEPEKRISSSQIVEELEHLLALEQQK
mmetsp:Transcript_17272/g.25352  ORF Transcript_17272/g.25352 Transcript_17272/m.25352 type:complete len:724 (+) Transcript_17272:457-2628(+)